MFNSRRSPLLSLLLAAALLPVTPSARAAVDAPADGGAMQMNAVRISNIRKKMNDRFTQEDREAAAKNLAELKARLEAAKRAARAKAAAEAAANGMSFAVETPPGVQPPGPGDVPDYFTTANWAFSPPLRKFVDKLAGLGPTGANLLGNYIPVAVPDTTTYPGSDYYEIWLEEYSQQLHSDLPPTRLRGYRQVNGPSPEATPRYLGPVIVAQRDRPVRILFRNKLPAGAGGDLFIPVDESVMGAGKGPMFPDGTTCDPTPPLLQNCAKFPQNRAAIHLHGGRTPWISDGTPHQWVVPAADELDPNQPYKKGVSYENVPDMPDPGPGAMTYYYSNQQSARLLFYHDHAWGITRLNVVVGEAAGYLITDAAEQALVTAGALPSDQIPLVIQERTFVDPDTIRQTDPTWNWGTGTPDANGVRPPIKGDLWFPHVYMPAQNPFDVSGANPFGRWVYGPWFFPPTTNILYGPVPNPYHDPACSSTDPAVFVNCTTPGQPPVIPGTPVPSVGMESFFDSAMVNGVVFPRLEVEPKAYRFRILNASNDRFMNLSIYEADPAQVSSDGRPNTEVKIIPAASGNWDGVKYPLWPADGREPGVPDPTTMGPPFIQVGTESGFLPRPVTVFSQPIGYVTDPTVFNFGNVKDHALLLGPAERADAVIDFSKYAGKTLILYNDAPAAFPARDARVDYYAGAPDLSDTGGHWGPQVGFGPNTRTIMQIVVANSPPATAFSVPNLEAAMKPVPGVKLGTFEASQDPILVGQATYNDVYTNQAGTDFIKFPTNWPAWGYARISDYNITFKTVGETLQTFPLEPKGIHDEMGAAFDMEYGRMSGNLGISIPFAQVGVNNFTLYDFTDPATEILNDAIEPLSPVLGDGTQIWKISQNGVDTHPVHFHVFDVQLLNRVGWDGLIRPPDQNELGWKETVRISPLEDTIVAMRMWAPQLPFGVPTSLRALNPAIPIGSGFGFTNVDPITQQAKVPVDLNRVEDFGWEYVWHCHILSHEEMDMMRPIILNVTTIVPAAPTGVSATNNGSDVDVSWNDPTPVNNLTKAGWGLPTAEIGFRVERATGPAGAFSVIGNALANQTTFKDTAAVAGTYYRYRVTVFNAAGSATSAVVARASGGTPTPADSVALTASPATTPYVRALPALGVDGSVAFTAAATGGVGVFEYRFSLDSGAGFQLVQDFSPNDVWVLPATHAAGLYTVQVEVRTSLGEAAPFPTATLAYEVQSNPVTTLVVAPAAASPSPHLYGTAVLFTATPTGGATAKEYQFSLQTDGGAFVVVQPWGAAATWSMPAATLPASFVVKAEVRTDLSASGITSATVPYVVQYGPATGLLLSASRASPAIKTITPTDILFTANATGSAGYKFRFWLVTNGGAPVMVRDWATGSTWTMPGTTAVGNYMVTAEVSTSNGAVIDRTASKIMNVITKAATGVNVSVLPGGRQNPGTTVTLTANGLGSAGYHYRFRLSTDGGAYVVARDWSTVATYSPPTATEANLLVIADVWADSAGTGPDASATPISVPIRLAPATNVTLTPSRTSPAPVNIVPLTTTFTAVGSGSSGGYQYRFSLDSGAGFAVVQDYGDPNGASWTMPADKPIGTYQVKVDVRTSALVDLDFSRTITFQLVAPAAATGVTLTPSTPSPVALGTAVTFTAQGQGSSGYQYQFWYNAGAGNVLASAWSATNTWTLPGSSAVGLYSVIVEVRTKTSVVRDAQTTVSSFRVGNGRATGVSVTPSKTSPQALGTLITFTAAGQGGTGTYEYQWFVNSGSGNILVQPYSTNATWTLPPWSSAATYTVSVQVRTNPSVAQDAVGTTTFRIGNAGATGVTLTPTPGSPVAYGVGASFLAAGQGSSGYEYQFWYNSGSGWVLAQAYSPTATWAMPSSQAVGVYQVKVQVRTNPTSVQDAATTITYQVGNLRATGVTVSANPTSPTSRTTPPTFTASGVGGSGTYLYAFWYNGGSGQALGRTFTSDPNWTMPANLPAGTYTITVQVKTNASTGADAQTLDTYVLNP